MWDFSCVPCCPIATVNQQCIMLWLSFAISASFFTLALPVSQFAGLWFCYVWPSDSPWEMIFWLVCCSGLDAQPSLWGAGQASSSCSTLSHYTRVPRAASLSGLRASSTRWGGHWISSLGSKGQLHELNELKPWHTAAHTNRQGLTLTLGQCQQWDGLKK